MRYIRQLVGDVSTTVRAVVRQGKQVMSRVLVDSVVGIASIHLGAAVAIRFTVFFLYAPTLGTHISRTSKYDFRMIFTGNRHPPPMPHGFCVDGGGAFCRNHHRMI